MNFFGKKKEENKPSISDIRGEVPLKRIESLKNQGLNEKQIIDTLKVEGYTLANIDKGFNQLSSKLSVNSNNAGPVSPINSNPNPFKQSGTEQKPNPPLVPNQSKVPESHEFDSWISTVQELIEAIVEERMSDLNERFEDINAFESKVEKFLDSKTSGLDEFDSRFNSLKSEVNGFRKDLHSIREEVMIELSGMQLAFKKLIPQLISSIRKINGSSNENEALVKNLESSKLGLSGGTNVSKTNNNSTNNVQNFNPSSRIVMPKNFTPSNKKILP